MNQTIKSLTGGLESTTKVQQAAVQAAEKQGIIISPSAIPGQPKSQFGVPVPPPQTFLQGGDPVGGIAQAIKDLSTIQSLTKDGVLLFNTSLDSFSASSIEAASFANGFLQSISESQAGLLESLSSLSELPDALLQIKTSLDAALIKITEKETGADAQGQGIEASPIRATIEPITINVNLAGNIDVAADETQAAIVEAIRKAVGEINGNALAKHLNPVALGQTA